MRGMNIRRHLQYFWWCYASIFIASVILWTSVYGIVASPDANERLTVSYFGNDCDTEALKSDIKNNIAGITSQGIIEISVDRAQPSESLLFGSMIQSSLYSSDIMIFEEGVITDEFIAMNFRPLTEGILARFSDLDVEYYTVDGERCGIIIDPTGSASSAVTRHYSGSGRLVVFFAPYSENLGAAYGIGDVDDEAAIEFMRYLLEEANEEN